MLKRATLFIGFCLLVGIWGPVAHAQTINAASCNASDVQRALNSVSSATATVVIPSGTCTWSSGITYTVPSGITNLTIQGQTALNCTGTAGTSSYACTATDNTVLVDANGASDQPLIALSVNGASQGLRLTGITFEGGNTSAAQPNGFLTVSGSSQNIRIDHCNFNTNTYSPLNTANGGMTTFGELNGVVDHNTFELYSEGNGVRVYNWGDSWGDISFSQPTQWGSSNFIFVENNFFDGVGAVNDCDEGGRVVVRYNTVEPNESAGSDAGLVQGHQMGQGQQRSRGCRAMEVYGNFFNNPYSSSLSMYSTVETGAATALVWGNTIGAGYSNGVIMENIREIGTGHTQTDASNGIGYCGSNSDGTTAPWDGNSPASTGYPCLDQTGRGQSDLMSGDFPNFIDSATGTATWPRQLLEPYYIWDETLGSANAYNNPAWNNVQMTANRDFYSQVGHTANTSPTSPFNGSSGTGWGTMANRPTSCTAGPGGTYGQSPTGSYGVAYWATDANSGNGELYICTGTNTWTAVYSPYTYPHPLVSGGTVESNAPNPPTGLIATIQ